MRGWGPEKDIEPGEGSGEGYVFLNHHTMEAGEAFAPELNIYYYISQGEGVRMRGKKTSLAPTTILLVLGV